ncbi:MAG TPA: carboxypeptidase-like regulatory domain-containing protein [Candidatus Sulfotelmatobacter sp.]|nr:carboxypeptidase-like regulatory domain-containing protein [Candidatus Sulfotelmatobacter sp.]
MALPVCASEPPGAISGYVRNASGVPQMGAVVEILGSEIGSEIGSQIGSASRTLTTFTDGLGFYSASGLLPGVYSVKVSAASFLPTVLDRIGLVPGAHLKVNVTLNTLLGALDVGRIRAVPDDDDWKWTLRSVANRPILRVFDDPMPPAEKQNHEIKGTLSFVAGSASDGYGSGSDMSTGFSLERSIFSTGRVGVSGNVGYGDGTPDAVFRTSYSHVLPNGSEPSLAVTVRRFAPSDPNLHNAALQAVTLAMGDSLPVGDVLELKFGSELQTIQFLGRVSAFRPYGSADLHLSPNTVLAYAYASSLPDSRMEKGFDSAPADMSEANPRVSLQGFAPKIERAHHQELALNRRVGNTNVQFAVFSDRVGDTALTGAGEVTAAGGFLLPDVYSGTFSYTGGTLNTPGLRAVVQHKFSTDLTATLDYAWGGTLNLLQPDVAQPVALQEAQQWIRTVRRQALAAKFNGTLPRTHTRWIASYRWVNGQALTPVDMFNSSPGQSDAYLSLFLRQPIPSMGFLTGHMEALIEVRNLLAQGYVPVVGQDGQTVYLVQAARSVRGGLAFSF